MVNAKTTGKSKSEIIKTSVGKSAKRAKVKTVTDQKKLAKPASNKVGPRSEAKRGVKPATESSKKSNKKNLAFSKGDYVVYPTHGVGKVTGIEKSVIAGFNLQLFVILFESEKMTLRVPVDKVGDSGLRKISSKDKMRRVVATLTGRARSKRTMWSRRAQEYEAKINSGDPVAIAEVVRDLYRAPGQPEQSYSERQMYEAALERLVHEFALVEKLDVAAATERIETAMAS